MEVKNMMDLTPFLLAVIHGAKETAELLLDRGANLLALDFAHNSCLHLAVMHKQVAMVQLLLDRGKEKLMKLERYDHKTVIHLAACYQETQVHLIVLRIIFH